MKKALSILLITLPAWAQEIEFNRDIRPILSSKCFACHGTDATHAEGHLRLDSLEAAIKGGDSEKPAIIPNNAAASELVQRILSDDPDNVMPPPDFHASLTLEEKDLLQRWIDGGAEYQVHWAYLAPEKVELPAVGASGSENPIDRFIEARLSQDDAELSAQPEREVLVRRMYLDLTGLPPTQAELRQYLELAPDEMISQLTSDLLASPHFGERLTVDWMDAARYADTHGNSIDGSRHMWLWRDWVIKSFNDNLPYDQFIKEQLAGDLMPNPTEQQLIATGFNRLHPLVQEGGTIPEENLTKYVVDRVKTTGESILGVTMACAQCHDHKYDPISQKEYYQFYAFFNTLSDKGRDGGPGSNASPMINAQSPLRNEQELAALKQELETVQAELDRPVPAAQQAWEQVIKTEHQELGKGFQARPLDAISSNSPSFSNPITIEGNGRYTPRRGVKPITMDFKIPADVPRVDGIRLSFLPASPLNEKQKKKPKNAVKSGITVTNISASFGRAPSPTVNLNALQSFSKISASSSSNWILSSPANIAQSTKSWTAQMGAEKRDVITLTFQEPINTQETPHLALDLQIAFDRLRPFTIETFTGNDPASAYPPHIVAAVLKENRTPQEQATLKDYFQQTAPQKAVARHAKANLQARIQFHEGKHSTMVMDTAEKPRKTHILNRGVYSDKLEEVQAATPAIFPPLQTAEGSSATRLDLAEWLIRDDHPLTSRVAVNRVWALFFGRGLSEALADFGSQGTYPSHPELFDWLAVDFRENGWDLKRLVRQIVSSKTYQQSSSATEEELKTDPKNTLLARGPRFRLQAEFIRDVFLKSSGLLRPHIGGASVNPYQPGDLWREVSHYGSVHHEGQTFVQDHGTKLYRRSLYTFWKRTLPPPNMVAFDAPNREICSAGRSATNTPLQALILLNDPQFVEAARVLAEELVQQGGDDVGRLEYAFQHITSRQLDEQQRQILTEQLQSERSYFQQNPDLSLGLLMAGEKALTVPSETYAELAAWTNTVSLIYNLSQTITRY